MLINVKDYGFTNFSEKLTTGAIFRKRKSRAFAELSSVQIISECNGISTRNGFAGKILAFNFAFYFFLK